MTTSIVSVSATQSALQVNGINSIVFNSAGDVQTVSQNGGQLAGMRNVIINGDMRIDQRNGGTAVTLNNTLVAYSTDRFNCSATGGTNTGTATVQRVLDGPPGLPYSLKWTTTSAKAPAATDNFYIYQPIEADNCAAFAFGTTGARSATFSFWVKASVVGTFGAFLRNDTAANTQRSYVINYAISVANTWEYKTITVPADTQTTAAGLVKGLSIVFDVGSGSGSNGVANVWQAGNFWRSANCVNLISTLNATFQITGVQLEAGPVATPFENRPVGMELALCQRYYTNTFGAGVPVADFQASTGSVIASVTTATGYYGVMYYYPVTMRSIPLFTYYAVTGGNAGQWRDGSNNSSSVVSATGASNRNVCLFLNGGANFVSPTANVFYVHVAASSEL